MEDRVTYILYITVDSRKEGISEQTFVCWVTASVECRVYCLVRRVRREGGGEGGGEVIPARRTQPGSGVRLRLPSL